MGPISGSWETNRDTPREEPGMKKWTTLLAAAAATIATTVIAVAIRHINRCNHHIGRCNRCNKGSEWVVARWVRTGQAMG